MTSEVHAPSTTTSVSSLLGIYYDKVLLENLYPELRFYELADRKPIPKGISKTITFTKMTKYAEVEGDLIEGTQPDPTWLSAGQITATIIQKGAVTPVSDLLDMTTINPVLKDAMAELGEQAGLTVDKYIYYRCFGDAASECDAELTGIGHTNTNDWSNFYLQHPTAAKQGFSTIFFSQDGSIPSIASLKSFITSVSAGTAAQYGLTVDTIQRAVHQLRADDVKGYKGDTYAMVVHPDSVLSLKRDESFKDWNHSEYAEKMFNGEVGMIDGVRILSSSNIAKTASSTLSVGTVVSGIFNVLLAPKGIAVTEIDGEIHHYVKTAGSAGTADTLDQNNTVGWKWTGCAKVLDEKRGKIVITLQN